MKDQAYAGKANKEGVSEGEVGAGGTLGMKAALVITSTKAVEFAKEALNSPTAGPSGTASFSSTIKAKPCKFYQRGRCVRGIWCTFAAHVARRPCDVNAQQEGEEDEEFELARCRELQSRRPQNFFTNLRATSSGSVAG